MGRHPHRGLAVPKAKRLVLGGGTQNGTLRGDEKKEGTFKRKKNWEEASLASNSDRAIATVPYALKGST
jgi:hypothetical protein